MRGGGREGGRGGEEHARPFVACWLGAPARRAGRCSVSRPRSPCGRLARRALQLLCSELAVSNGRGPQCRNCKLRHGNGELRGAVRGCGGVCARGHDRAVDAGRPEMNMAGVDYHAHARADTRARAHTDAHENTHTLVLHTQIYWLRCRRVETAAGNTPHTHTDKRTRARAQPRTRAREPT